MDSNQSAALLDCIWHHSQSEELIRSHIRMYLSLLTLRCFWSGWVCICKMIKSSIFIFLRCESHDCILVRYHISHMTVFDIPWICKSVNAIFTYIISCNFTKISNSTAICYFMLSKLFHSSNTRLVNFLVRYYVAAIEAYIPLRTHNSISGFLFIC